MSMFSDYSLEEAEKHFAKFLASEEFKKMSKEYFSSLMNKEDSNADFSKETSTVRLNSVDFLMENKITSILPNQILNSDEVVLAA